MAETALYTCISVELGDISAELPWTPFWSMMNESINLYHDERTQTSDYYKPRKEPVECCGESILPAKEKRLISSGTSQPSEKTEVIAGFFF